MESLASTAPSVNKELEPGNFVVKQKFTTFKQVSSDLAIEHLDIFQTVKGHLVGIILNASARDRWFLTTIDKVDLWQCSPDAWLIQGRK